MPWQGRTAQTKRPRPITPAARRGKPEKQRSKEHETCKEDHHRRRTGGNGSGGVRPGAGGGADLLAVPVGMVSAGTVPAVGVPASRLALAVLHPGRFWTFAGGVRFST